MCYLFASICYHYYYLNENLHVKNKLRGAKLFISAANIEIRKHTILCFPLNATFETPLFTGSPPHVLLMAPLEGLKEKTFFTKTEIVSEMQNKLAKHHVVGKSFQAADILDKVN